MALYNNGKFTGTAPVVSRQPTGGLYDASGNFQGSQQTPTAPEQSFFQQIGSGHFIPSLSPTNPSDVRFSSGQQTKDIIRPEINLFPSIGNKILKGAYDASQIPGAISGLANEGGAEGLARGGVEIGKSLLGPVYGGAQAILGGVQHGVNALTGAPVMDAEKEKAYQSAIDAISHPVNTLQKGVNAVYNTSQTSPETIPMVLQGVGKTLNKNGIKSVYGVPTNDVIAGIADPVIAGAKTAAVPVISAIASKAQNAVEQDWKNTLKLTPKQKQFEYTTDKNSSKILAKEQVPLPIKVPENGKLVIDPTNSIDDLEPKYQAKAALFKEVIKGSDAYTDWGKYRQQVLSNFEKYNSRLPALDYEKGLAQLNDSLDAEEKYFSVKVPTDLHNPTGNFKIPVPDLEDMKQSYSGRVHWADPNAKVTSAVNNSIYNTAKDTIANEIPDARIHAMNAELGDYKQALDMLEARRGATVGAGMLGRTIATATGAGVGAAVGSVGGPIGTVAGAVIGGWTAEKLAEFMANHNFSSSMAEALVRRLQGSSEGQQLVDHANAILQERAAAQAARPLLADGGNKVIFGQPYKGSTSATPQFRDSNPTVLPRGDYNGTYGPVPIPQGPGTANVRGITNPSRLPEQGTVDSWVNGSTGFKPDGSTPNLDSFSVQVKYPASKLRPLPPEAMEYTFHDLGGHFEKLNGIPGVADYLRTMLGHETFTSWEAFRAAVNKLVAIKKK